MKAYPVAPCCLVLACCVVGCAPSGGGGGTGGVDGGNESVDGGQTQGFAVRSDAFADQQAIPPRYTIDGDDISPPLVFEAVPAEAVELALTVVDPDAPDGDFVHWVIYKIPAATTGLAEAIPTDETLANPPGAVQGENDFGDIGYRGPAPPPGETHRYVFTLYALGEPLDLAPGADRATLLETMEGLILAQSQTTGTYSR